MVCRGAFRTVLLIGSWAIKFPSMRNGAQFFVAGMLSNVLEQGYWHASHHPQLAPVYHCGPLGLWLVMQRFAHAGGQRLSPDAWKSMPFVGIDMNPDNVGVDGDRLVLIDYGYTGWYWRPKNPSMPGPC